MTTSAVARDNETGFWEHPDGTLLNQRLMSSMGSTWDCVRLPEDEWQASPEFRPLIHQAQSILEEDFPAEAPILGLKDPRLCITLPLWLEAAKRLALEPRTVYLIREPQQIANSLHVRNGLPFAKAFELTLLHWAYSERASRDLPRTLLTYDELLEDWQSTLSRSCEDLDLDLDFNDEAIARIDSLVSRKHQHHFIEDRDVVGTEFATPPRVAQFYRALSKVPREGWNAANSHAEAAMSFLRERQLFAPAWPSTDEDARRARDLEEMLQELPKTMSSKAESIRYLLERNDRLGRENRNLVDETTYLVGRCRADLKRTLAEAARENSRIQEAADHTIGKLSAEITELRGSLLRVRSQVRELELETEERTRREARREQLRQQQSQGHALVEAMRSENEMLREQLLRERHRVFKPIYRNLYNLVRPLVDLLPESVLARLRRFISHPDVAELDSAPPAHHAPPVSAQEPNHSPGAMAPQETMAPRGNVVFFPVIDWDFRIQRPQHLASVLAQSGYRVLFLTTDFQDPAAGSFTVVDSPTSAVYVVRLACPRPHPNIYTDVATNAQVARLCESLDDLLAATGSEVPPTYIVHQPFWTKLFTRSDPGSFLIYDCLDYHAGFENVSSEHELLEDQLLDMADLVVTTSDPLAEKLGPVRDSVVIRNGAEIEHFSRRPATLRLQSKKPVAGYFGAISEWFDMDLIEACARRLPEVDFVLIGDTHGADTRIARDLPNVQFLGELPYHDLPGYLHAFDVCLIPFKLTELIRCTNPVKFYEYLSAGKPVVATAIPELLPHEAEGLVRIGRDSESFSDHVAAALAEDTSPVHSDRARTWVQQHSWENRGRDFLVAIDELHPLVSVVVLCHNNLEFTQACLSSIQRFSWYPRLEVICVDNGSADETPLYLASLEAKDPKIKYVRSHQNLGFAGGNNLGLERAKGDFLVILNNDTFVTSGWIQGLQRHLRRHPNLGLIGPVTNAIGNEARIEIQYSNMEEMALAADRYCRRRRFELLVVDSVAFFAVMLPRHVYEAIGPLDDDFGLGFFEDDDYCRRVKAAGLDIAIAEDVFIHHHLSASFTEIGQQRRDEAFERSKKIFEKKWGKWKPHEYRPSLEATAADS